MLKEDNVTNSIKRTFATHKTHILPFGLMLIIPLVSVIYKILNNPNRGVFTLVTDIDRSIPLVKLFIIPYLSWEVFLVLSLSYLAVRDRTMYYRTLTSIILSMLICYGIYYVYQTTVPRPELLSNDVLTQLVALTYRYNQPFNCFPSIHSLTSFIMIKAFMNTKAKSTANLITVSTMAILIILSTLFVKQHVILDVLAAIILGNLVFKLLFNRERLLSWTYKPFLSWMMKKKYVTWSKYI